MSGNQSLILEQLQMIEDCEKRQEHLSEWECNFIDSISRQIQKKDLTQKQYETLESVWEKATKRG